MSYIEDLFSLRGSNAVVTGAASGLGFQCAQVMAKAGANVALLDINNDGLGRAAKLAAQTGGKALPLQVDISQQEQVEAALRQVAGAFGAIHILVNCAGIILVKTALENTEQDWDRVFDVEGVPNLVEG